MNLSEFSSPRSTATHAKTRPIYQDDRGVYFWVPFGGASYECLVTHDALQALDVFESISSGPLAIYRKHQARIQEIARGLIAMGLRGPRLVVRLHHFMD